MSYVRISNDSFFDKDYYSTFAKQEKFVFFNVGSSFSALVPFYKELLQEVLGEKVKETFQDYALSAEETSQIQKVFERELEKLLPEIEYGKPPHRRLEWKGNSYDLNLSLTSPNNRQLADYKEIIDICVECLQENKPMYLSID